jgi:amino acid adenylation domain-containing protein
VNLHDLVVSSARRDPDAEAVCGPAGSLTYGELDRLADRYAAALASHGVRQGDRVLIWCEKSADAVALMQAALRMGAIYVPVAPGNPVVRLRRIAASCRPAIVVTDEDRAKKAAAAGWPAPLATFGDLRATIGPTPKPTTISRDSPAYILYTSGSTGEPKGVCISHRNALAFVEWAAAEVGLYSGDRLANHAPFNFDLSVFDLYGAFLAGASVHLIPGTAAYAPEQLVDLVERCRITVWYSVPSVLLLMMRQGGLMTRPAPESLRVCVFAGEPFPVGDVVELRGAWPQVRLFNWYGPTETNVCTSYEVTDADLGRTRPLPIGAECSGDRVWLHPEGADEGEIVVAGPTVMIGYWDGPRQDGPYRTGDIGRYGDTGELEYVGRRDDMVKVRGHRVELGEIEAALGTHDAVDSAAVIVRGAGMAARIHAVVVARPGTRPTLIQLKRHCADQLPSYMIIDELRLVDALPRTENGKTDRAALTVNTN